MSAKLASTVKDRTGSTKQEADLDVSDWMTDYRTRIRDAETVTIRESGPELSWISDDLGENSP